MQEQLPEADTRRYSGVRRPISSKPDTCTERCDVDPTGLSVKVGAQYPGRSVDLPCAIDLARCREGSPEVSRSHSSRASDEGLNLSGVDSHA